MEQPDEIVIPEIEDKPRQKRKLTVWIAAVVVSVAAVAAIVFAKIYFNEERALLKGIQNLAEEVKERQELSAVSREGTFKAETSFNVSVENMPVTLGIDIQILRDADARKMQSSADVSVMNNKLAKLEIYGEDETLIVAVPTLWEQNFAFETKQIDKQYNASLLAQKWGRIDGVPEISFDLFEEKDELSWVEILIHCQEIIKEFEVERVEKKIVVSIPEKDNKQYRCSQYRVIMPTVEITGMERDILDEYMTLLISVDENDQIVQIILEEPLLLTEGKLTGGISFVGENRGIDDIIVNMQMSAVKDLSQLDEGFFSEFGGENTERIVEMELCAESVYHENDTSVTTNIDKLTVSVEQIGTAKVTGKFTILPLQEEIEAPAGETLRLFEITEAEYDSLREQMMKKLLWKIGIAASLFK